MTLSEFLKGLSTYPVSDGYLVSIAQEVGADMTEEVSDVDRISLYRLQARVYLFLATAPNVSEGGVSISYTAEDKRTFLALAKRYAALAGENGLISGPAYGYKGENP